MGSRATFDGLIASNLRILQANLTRLRREMRTAKDFDEKHADQAARLAKSVASLAAEDRQREKKAEKDADEMSHAERRETILEIFDLLPPEHQVELYRQLRRKMSAMKAVR